MPLTVRRISSADHLDFITERGTASFLQCPSWGSVKTDWRSASLGWMDGSRLVGAGLVLLRQIPRVQRYLAYLPEGPILPWEHVVADVPAWVDPMVEFLRQGKAFAIKMGPPVALRTWESSRVKAALADPSVTRLADVPADSRSEVGEVLAAQLERLGWRPPASGDGFAIGQPRHVFQLPLAGRSESEVLAGFNQLWRRNIKKAEKAGVVVREGTGADLPAFHALYVHTAERDRFTPRPLAYFERMWEAMRAEERGRIRLYLAEHEGDLLAATTMVIVGTHAWYSYGASASHKREVRPSNAVQWRMIRDAMAAGCEVYDLRGITETLSPDDPLHGLIQFKVGTGGRAVEYVGEWDLPLNRLLFRGYEAYLSRRASSSL